MKVAVTCVQLQRDIDLWRSEFANHGAELVLPEVRSQGLAGEDLRAALLGVDGVIAGDDVFDRDVLSRLPRLRVISKWGVGTDGIDSAAAREHGVTVLNTPGAFSDEVADVAFGYIVLLARHLHVIDREVRAGRWVKPVGTSLARRTLGVVGLGAIGSEVARRGQASKMTVIGCDPSSEAAARSRALGVELVEPALLLRRSEFLVLCCALTAGTYHFLDRSALTRVVPGVRIVNVARGRLVEEEALIEAIEDGRVAGAALDVMEDEPLPASSRLRGFDQVILGSHNASNTYEACERVHRIAITNLFSALSAS